MATQRTATVWITNQTDGTAQIQLSHQNDTNGTQSGSWTAEPGDRRPAHRQLRDGHRQLGVLDWWTVTMTVENGSQPGIYQNTGTSAFPHWKECQLQTGDVDKQMYFAVTTTEFYVNPRLGRLQRREWGGWPLLPDPQCLRPHAGEPLVRPHLRAVGDPRPHRRAPRDHELVCRYGIPGRRTGTDDDDRRPRP